MNTLRNLTHLILLAAGLYFLPVTLYAQTSFHIHGRVMDEKEEGLGFATIALYQESDSAFISGTVSDQEGYFSLSHPDSGNYYLLISFVGFETHLEEIRLQKETSIELGNIVLPEERIELAEASILGERIKARQEVDKTTYFINMQMEKASGTVMDLIKYIPGVQVDLFHNISLEGNNQVLILVNGKERDGNFLNQLNPVRIDKIEIRNRPGAEFRSDVSGVINVILKDEETHGISGHLYSEIPVRQNEVYAFPSANINLSLKKVNLYASYSGELSYFDIEGKNTRNMTLPGQHVLMDRSSKMSQEYWSHKFHYGLDFFHDKRNQFSLYGYVNPYSAEFDGTLQLNEYEGKSLINSRTARQDESDLNLAAYATAYYQHMFRNPGSELSVDLNYYRFRGNNNSRLSEEDGDTLWSSSHPVHQAFSTRVDLQLPLREGLMLKAGIREMKQEMSDASWNTFHYGELISAGYASIAWNPGKIQMSGGLRIEHALQDLPDSQSAKHLSFLPRLSANLDLTAKSTLGISYQKKLQRPSISQLNSNIQVIDPYSSMQGNPELDPAVQQELSLDYSHLQNNNYLSAAGFISRSEHHMEYLARVSNEPHVLYSMENLGHIDQVGMKLLGSLKPLKNVSFNPYMKVYGAFSRGNQMAHKHGITDQNRMVLESGFSLSALFGKDFVFSTMLKYHSARVGIQRNSFEDMLYFVSIEKTFKEKYMIGLSSAVPFRKSFTYQGSETYMQGFSEYSEDNIQMSMIPLWIKFKYTFASGRKNKRIERSDDFTDKTGSKGLF
jgi:hypothetical protein